MSNGAELNVAEILGGPADARTVAATVAQRLRARILDGQLRPGATLRLTPLAHNLGVSAMPVREALRSLEGEGLVVVRPRRGAVVAELSAEDAEEIYAMRVALESLCARHGAERLGPADVADIEQLFGRMEEQQQAWNLAAFIDLDHAFHSRLYAVSWRERLIRMIGDLQNRSRRYLPYIYGAWPMVENPDPGSIAPVRLEAHRPILVAIQEGNKPLVERLTREHMEQAAGRLLREIVRQTEGRRVAR